MLGVGRWMMPDERSAGVGFNKTHLTLTPPALTSLFRCPQLNSTRFIMENEKKTYNTRDSLVVTDPTTDLALTDLTRGERTGSRIFP